MSTTAKIEQFEVGRMLQELGLTDIIDGEIDSVEIDLTGSGRSVAGLMASLDGKAIIIMGQGKLKNSYIGLAGGSLGPSLFRLLNPLEEKGKYTLTNCLVCRSDIRDGLADVTALVLDTSSMSVIGEGDVNLKTERLNISLKPVPKEGVGNFSLGLGELSRPFILGGTLAQPALAIDMTQSAITLSRAVGAGALFGPAGVAAALLGQTKGEENPCLAAIEASGKGGKITEGKGSEETGTAGDTVEDSSKGIGGAFKKIFGK